MIKVKGLSKKFDSGLVALDQIDLDIKKGEILALLGPNGAGKTTLISSICGLINPSTGTIKVGGYDVVKQYRKARQFIGLVPQELTTDAFETVWNTVSFTRGLFGNKRDDIYISNLLKDLSLYEKKDNKLMTLSGGMKRRVLIAKALSHEPEILFLDEPTAGVDVELRKSMWEQVRRLQQKGVTVILTTHYIEEAEEMADRIGVISKGRLLLVENKQTMMEKLGAKRLVFDLPGPIDKLPDGISNFSLQLSENKTKLIYEYDQNSEDQKIAELIQELGKHQIIFKDLYSEQNSLEDIFVSLVKQQH